MAVAADGVAFQEGKSVLLASVLASLPWPMAQNDWKAADKLVQRLSLDCSAVSEPWLVD